MNADRARVLLPLPGRGRSRHRVILDRPEPSHVALVDQLEAPLHVLVRVIEGREPRAEPFVEPPDRDAEVTGHLLEVGDDDPLAHVADGLVEAAPVADRLLRRHAREADHVGEDRPVRLADQHHRRDAPADRGGDLRRGVEVVGDVDGLRLRELERRDRERVRRPLEPVDHDLGAIVLDDLAHVPRVLPAREREVHSRMAREPAAQLVLRAAQADGESAVAGERGGGRLGGAHVNAPSGAPRGRPPGAGRSA